MGGKTFPNVPVPRMSPGVYQRLSAECQAKLETIFNDVVVPRDAPGKPDFGDIDFLVEGIQNPSANLWTQVKTLLGAELYVANGSSHSFAIPHPDIPSAYAQVDVELSPGNGTPNGASLFAWTRFMKGDSDLLQILGIAHRALGILCNNQGLHIRIEAIEPYNKKKALLFLTRDPDAAMEFYGLDSEKYWDGFASEEELFDWATSGRFFAAEIFEQRVEKNNDRARQAKRPMYRRFVEEYMPKHADKNGECTWTREQVLEEAIGMFNVEAEYDAMMGEHHFKETEEEIWQEVREVVPLEGTSLVTALRGLRRWVAFENGEPQLAAVPDLEDKSSWSKLMAPGSNESLMNWVKEHWEATKALEKARASAAKISAMA